MNRTLDIYVLQRDREDIHAMFRTTEEHASKTTVELALHTGAEILVRTDEGTRVEIECTEADGFQFLLSFSRVGMSLHSRTSFKNGEEDFPQAEAVREQLETLLNHHRVTVH